MWPRSSVSGPSSARTSTPHPCRSSAGSIWLANALDAELRPPFAAEGLGNGDFDVLAALRRAGSPYALRHRDLTASMLVTPGAVTKRVDRLLAKGLVTRGAHESDGRGQLVRLTRAGVRFVDRMIEVHLAERGPSARGAQRPGAAAARAVVGEAGGLLE